MSNHTEVVPILRRAGTRGILMDLTDLAQVGAVRDHLESAPLTGQVDVIAAARTVLVTFTDRRSTNTAWPELQHLEVTPGLLHSGREILIEVDYDGEDLDEVGRLTGLGRVGVIRAHTEQLWTGAFCGFIPGFTYLTGQNESLHVPRLDVPRTAVPRGSVALGGPLCGIYPRPSPGGFRILGRTDATLWDSTREQPVLIQPGDTVRFQPRTSSITVRAAAESADTFTALPAVARHHPAVIVRATGMQTLVQDLGRAGHARLGVPVSGAADRRAARQANELVGNPPTDAVLEQLAGGLVLQAQGEQVLAVAGAAVELSIATPPAPAPAQGATPRTVPMDTPFTLHDGETLTLGVPVRGLRSYVAVRSGLAVDPVLGSRATDVMSAIGPAPLSVGSVLPIGEHPGEGSVVGNPLPATLSTAALAGRADTSATAPRSDTAPIWELRITLGPRDDWFTTGSLARLTQQLWRVTAQSNRAGLRLEPAAEQPEGGALHRVRSGELPSEGVVSGSLQVPPSGHPVLFLADHPVTGGYPVVAVVVPEDLHQAGQARPGELLRFSRDST